MLSITQAFGKYLNIYKVVWKKMTITKTIVGSVLVQSPLKSWAFDHFYYTKHKFLLWMRPQF